MIQIPKERDESLNRDSVLKGMEEAWLDHRHCRDQTWRSVTATIALAVGFVTLEMKVSDPLLTALAGVFVLASAFSGMLITRHHRTYEIRKFTHIMQCEYWLRLRELGLRQDKKEFISKSGLLHWEKRPESVPDDIAFFHIFLPWKQNTPLFLIRVHAAIFVFTLLYFRKIFTIWGDWIVLLAGGIALTWFLAADIALLVKGRSKPNQASEASSQPAPGPNSSARQG